MSDIKYIHAEKEDNQGKFRAYEIADNPKIGSLLYWAMPLSIKKTDPEYGTDAGSRERFSRKSKRLSNICHCYKVVPRFILGTKLIKISRTVCIGKQTIVQVSRLGSRNPLFNFMKPLL